MVHLILLAGRLDLPGRLLEPLHIGDAIMKKIALTLMFVFVFCSAAGAEIIYFKDGRVIRGKIVERGNYYIKVMEGRIPKQYYNEEIDKIVDEDLKYKWDPSQIDASSFPGITPIKVLLILEHLELNGARVGIQRNIELLLDQTPEGQHAKVRELLRITEIVKVIIPVYSETYSEQELREMNDFLKTPTGSKMVSVAPAMVEATAKVMVEFFKGRMEELRKTQE